MMKNNNEKNEIIKRHTDKLILLENEKSEIMKKEKNTISNLLIQIENEKNNTNKLLLEFNQLKNDNENKVNELVEIKGLIKRYELQIKFERNLKDRIYEEKEKVMKELEEKEMKIMELLKIEKN